jgi:membrane protein implicated in regulation of membrane protease activity
MYDNKAKILVPAAVVLCMVGFYVSVGVDILKLPLSVPVKVFALLAPAALSCVVVVTVVKRIRSPR